CGAGGRRGCGCRGRCARGSGGGGGWGWSGGGLLGGLWCGFPPARSQDQGERNHQKADACSRMATTMPERLQVFKFGHVGLLLTLAKDAMDHATPIPAPAGSPQPLHGH
ncbi:MAG: hypothetical protein F4Y36_10285, partial [Acidimicrobiia bacterium]|nr:hypothetical protein [Acidimicrobiia bacterium]